MSVVCSTPIIASPSWARMESYWKGTASTPRSGEIGTKGIEVLAMNAALHRPTGSDCPVLIAAIGCCLCMWQIRRVSSNAALVSEL
jgi:hypothetical protein